jgi:precorrin-6B methylase 2
MAKAPRSADFDLGAALAKPSFTPGAKDIPGLIELIVGGAEPGATRAAPALAKLGEVACGALQAKLGAKLEEGAKARLVSTLGLLARAGNADAQRLVLHAAEDPEVRVRKAAFSALGKLGGESARAAVIARWDAGDVPADERRVLAEALGKLGGDAAKERLAAATTGDDKELERRRDRALLMADRSSKRDVESAIATDVAPPAPLTVRLGCRIGLGPLLVEELSALGMTPRMIGNDVEVTLTGPWSQLFASRLWATAAIQLGSITPAARHAPRKRRDKRATEHVVDPEALGAAIVEAILAPRTRGLITAWTRGPIRWRLGFVSGHKRSIVWRVARDVTAAAPELINDPQATTWDIQVDDEAGTIALVPRRFVDPRWAWRVADVPAASHPSVAAALVRVAGVTEGEAVWDPFCGSGLEVIEAALRGATAFGTDLDERALEAAEKNRAAAGVTAKFVASDARAYECHPVAAIVTNPPLGSRVHVDAVAMLNECVPNLARQLAPGGRLVWITPSSRKTSPAAEAAGLTRALSIAVDLGGVRGHLERWTKPR